MCKYNHMAFSIHFSFFEEGVKMDQSVKIRMTIGGKTFIASMLDIPPVRGIIAQCPFKLSFSRSAEHEYYARLPVKVDIQGCKGVSNIQANKLYLFAAWNAFSLNFLEMNISPYEVIELGSFDEDLVDSQVIEILIQLDYFREFGKSGKL